MSVEWATLIVLLVSFSLMASAHKTQIEGQAQMAYIPLIVCLLFLLVNGLFNTFEPIAMFSMVIVALLYLVYHQLNSKSTTVFEKPKVADDLAAISALVFLGYAYLFASQSLNSHTFIIFVLSLNTLFILYKKAFKKSFMTAIVSLNILIMQVFIFSFWQSKNDDITLFMIATLANFAIIPLAIFTQNEKGYSSIFDYFSIPLSIAQIAYLSAVNNLPVNAFTSAFWAFTAIVFFSSGLLIKHKSLRATGLILLGVCIVRVFVNDIHETLYRIIAFTVLAIILLIVAYLYSLTRRKTQETAKP